jgi:hypothetical protein
LVVAVGGAAIVPVAVGTGAAICPGPGAAASSIEVLITFAIESWNAFARMCICSRFSAAGPHEYERRRQNKLSAGIVFFIADKMVYKTKQKTEKPQSIALRLIS